MPPRAEPDLLSFLDLVALGTVADVVPLTGLNRAFVAKRPVGVTAPRDNAGLTALMDVARLLGRTSPGISAFLLGHALMPGAGPAFGRARARRRVAYA